MRDKLHKNITDRKKLENREKRRIKKNEGKEKKFYRFPILDNHKNY